MPFTHYHFGPGLALKGLGGGRFSFWAYTLAQVAIDVQPGIAILAPRVGLEPHAAYTHSFLTATAIGALAGLAARWSAKHWLQGLPMPLRPNKTLLGRYWLLSGMLGGWLHIPLDSLVYPDMHPFWPLLRGNPLPISFQLAGLQVFCIAAGLIGAVLILLNLRRHKRKYVQH